MQKTGYAGTQLSLSVQAPLDMLPPFALLNAPEYTKEDPVLVSGAMEPGATVTVAGLAVSPSPQGTFSSTVALNPGANLIQARATDDSDNVGYMNRLVLWDTVSPVLTVLAPGDGSVVQTETVLVQGYAESEAVVALNDTVVVTDSVGSFEAWALLHDGPNLLTLVATDQAGNSTTATRTVHRITAIAGVGISGTTVGVIGAGYTFTATVSPAEATQPISYTWQATGQPPVTHANGGLADSSIFAWDTAGTMTVTVTASDLGSLTSQTRFITISAESDEYHVYLPLVLRAQP